MSQTTQAPPALFSHEWWQEVVHAVVTTASLEGARLLNARFNPDGAEGVDQAMNELIETARAAAGHPSLDDLGIHVLHMSEDTPADESPVQAERIGSLDLATPLADYEMTLSAALKVQSRASSHVERAREMHDNAIKTLLAVAQSISPVNINDEIPAYTSPLNGHFSRPRRVRVTEIGVSRECLVFPTDWKKMKVQIEDGRAFVAHVTLVRKDGQVALGDAYHDEVPLNSLRARIESGVLVVESAPPVDED